MSKAKEPEVALSPAIEIEMSAGGAKRRVKVRTMDVNGRLTRVVVDDAAPAGAGVPGAGAMQALGGMARSVFGMR